MRRSALFILLLCITATATLAAGPEVTLLRPCYRGSIYATERLSEIVLQVAPAEGQATVRCELLDAAGAACATVEAEAGRDARPVRLPIPDLRVGTYELVTTALGAGGQALGVTRTPVRKLPPPPVGNEVRIDELGSILVNGRPFVGIGWYGGAALDRQPPATLALQNLQTPQTPSVTDLSSIADPYREHGVYSVVSLQHGTFPYECRLPAEVAARIATDMRDHDTPSPEVIEAARQVIEAVRGEPGLLGYYISDEPEINGYRPAYLEAYYRLLCELDPYHPVIVTNDTLEGIVTHGYRCADILSPDPYDPLPDFLPTFMRQCRKVMRPGQALALTPWHASGQTHFTYDQGEAPPYPYRAVHAQYLASLVYGARLWSGYATAFYLPEIEYRYGLPHIWREVRFLESAMAAPPPEQPLRYEPSAGVTGWIRQANGHSGCDAEQPVYVVLVNETQERRQVTASHGLLADGMSLREVSQGRNITVADGALRDTLEPGAAHLYTTDPHGRELPTVRAVEADLAARLRAAARPGNVLHVSTGARAVASGGYYAPWFYQYYYYAINGMTDDEGWSLTHARGKPEWLEVLPRNPARIARVVIHTPSLADFDLRFQTPEGRYRLAQVRGSTKPVVSLSFSPPIPCVKLRITALKAREGAGVPRVAEIEAYETPGPEPPTPVRSVAGERPERLTPALPAWGAGDPWVERFAAVRDGVWSWKSDRLLVESRIGGGLDVTGLAAGDYVSLTRTIPYSPQRRFLQVRVAAVGPGRGYRFTTVRLDPVSGEAGFGGAVNTARPGIYTVDTFAISPTLASGEADACRLAIWAGGATAREGGVVQPGPRFSYDGVRMAARPEDGLVVTLADGSPLPRSLHRGDELALRISLREPAQDAIVDVLSGWNYDPFPLNGKPYVQLTRAGASDGREWEARLRIGASTGTYDASGYPVVFRAVMCGGAVRTTYASVSSSFE